MSRLQHPDPGRLVKLATLRKVWSERQAAPQRGVIGPGGVEAPSKIHMQPNTIYYMGASSSPDMVIVMKVDKDTITFRKHPFDKDQRIQRWIGEDLIARGSKTWLNSGYVKYFPDVARNLKTLLSGKPGKKINPRDYQYVTVQFELDPSIDWNDGYTFTQHWGVLTGTPEDAGKDYWEVQMPRGEVAELKKDRKVTKVRSVK